MHRIILISFANIGTEDTIVYESTSKNQDNQRGAGNLIVLTVQLWKDYYIDSSTSKINIISSNPQSVDNDFAIFIINRYTVNEAYCFERQSRIEFTRTYIEDLSVKMLVK